MSNLTYISIFSWNTLFFFFLIFFLLVHCASTFGVIEAECSSPALLLQLEKSRSEVTAGGRVAVESGRGSTLGFAEDERPTTLELPLWVDENDSATLLSNEVGGDSDDDDDGGNKTKSSTTPLPSTLLQLNPQAGTWSSQREQRKEAVLASKSTTAAVAMSHRNDHPVQHLLQWSSGRRQWHSILELAVCVFFFFPT